MLTAAPGFAQEAEKEIRVEIHEAPIRAVFVDEDGEPKVIEKHAFSWTAEDGEGPHEGRHRVRFIDFSPHRRFIGLQLLDLTPELREHFGVEADSGVMVSKILPDTPAARSDLAVGDIVLSADGDDVANARDLSLAIAEREPGEEVELELFRDGSRQTVRVAVEQRERRMVDITKGLPLQDLPQILQDVDIDKALSHLQDYMGSEEWRNRLKHLEDTDWEGVDERMKSVEKRLRELERALEDSETP
jgi:hypothetical protein